MRSRLWLLAFTISLGGCASAITPNQCARAAGLVRRAPPNFGEVLTKDGAKSGVLRGGELTDCSQLAFLEDLGVTHILELNASAEEAAAGPHKEAGFDVMPVNFSAFTVGRDSTCPRVAAALDYLEDRSHWPVYVHCSAGRDRTGYVIGLFERDVLGRSADSVLRELAAFGHTGIWSLLFGQIDRELASAAPACSKSRQ